MRKLRALFMRLAGLFDHGRRDQDLAAELESHLQLHTEDNIRRGMDASEARRNARIRLGGLEAVKEGYRDRLGVPLLESLFQDLRYAGRMLRLSPGFTITALASLGLGIGANSAVFTLANAALWRPLPVAHPENLVLVWAIREDGRDRLYPPARLAEELGLLSGAFSGAATRTDDGLSFSFEDGRSERIVGEVVSPNYFEFLGVKPILGRGFSENVQTGHWAAEVVLSHRFWQQRFGGDPGVLGRTIRLNSYPFTIVGITPPGFFGVVVGWDPELRLPLMPAGQKLSQLDLLSSDSGQIVARLIPGVGLAQAEAAADVALQQFLNDSHDAQLRSNPMRHLRVRSGSTGWQEDVAEFRQPLLVLLGLAALVLLIACSNLANLLLARATARRRELAVRAAIGAGRARLVRQLLVECLLLSGLGAGVGFALSVWLSRVLFGFLPQGHIAITLNVDPDARAAWFTVGLSLFTAAFLGLMSGLWSTRGDIAFSLRSDSGGSVGDARGSRLRKGLVIGQVALSVLLLALAGTFGRSLEMLRSGELFAQPNRVLLFTMKPQHELYGPDKMISLTAEVVRRMSSLPGVQSAALAENGPLGSRAHRGAIERAPGEIVEAAADSVSSSYFDAIGLPLIAGRDFSAIDTISSARVIIINEFLARLLFEDENPLGRTVFIHEGKSRKLCEVVGIARASRYYDLHVGPQPAYYTDMQQDPAYMPTLHVRMSAGYPTSSVTDAVRREFASIDRDFPVFNVKTLEDRVNDSLARERLLSELAAAFGALALLLTLVGIYGTMSYSVAQREREIGVRTALGATRAGVLAMVLKESMVLVVLGIAAGVPATVAPARLISSQLSGISTLDPLTLGAVALLMLLVAALAGFLPARRASRLDPITALRCE